MAPLKRYSIGDIVELKSGSPDMTVTAVFENGVAVAWCGSDDSGVLHQSELPLAAIREVQPEPPRRDDRPPANFSRQPAFSRGNYDEDIPF